MVDLITFEFPIKDYETTINCDNMRKGCTFNSDFSSENNIRSIIYTPDRELTMMDSKHERLDSYQKVSLQKIEIDNANEQLVVKIKPQAKDSFAIRQSAKVHGFKVK